MKEKSICSRTDGKYSPHPQDTGKTKTGALIEARIKEEEATGALKGKGRGKGAKGKNQTEGKDKSKILCKHVKDNKRCPNHPAEGGTCECNRRKREFDDKGKHIGQETERKRQRSHGCSGRRDPVAGKRPWATMRASSVMSQPGQVT